MTWLFNQVLGGRNIGRLGIRRSEEEAYGQSMGMSVKIFDRVS